MQSVACKEELNKQPSRIYFPQHIFGKPNKHRGQDPNMFDLLSWGSDGFERHAFKKDEKFKEPTEAYLNMIGRCPWTSEAQQSYANYHSNCIEANEQVLSKIQNYIEERKPEVKSCSKAKKGEKKVVQVEGKKQNKYNPSNYTPKVDRRTETEAEVGKYFKANSSKLLKKGTLKNDFQNADNKMMVSKSYALDKTKEYNKEFTEQEQQKLIEKFKQTTRWIPNSAFTTYFGKPPFENYGRGNTNPIDGGLVYGTYLYSHNVHPHRGKNQPSNIQSYPVALNKAKSMGTLIPSHPRTKAEQRQVKVDLQRSLIQPVLNNFMGELDIQRPRMSEMKKFGGKRKLRVTTQVPRN